MPESRLQIAFIIATDAHLEIACELARELRTIRPDATLWVISWRTELSLAEFHMPVLQRTFSQIVTPRFRRAFRLANSILRRLGDGRASNRSSRPRLSALYPKLFRKGRAIDFDFVFTLNDRTFPVQDFVREFQAVRVPVALVQESIRRDDTSSRAGEEIWNGQGGCDVIYAWGDTSVDYYLRVGVSRERILPVGSPRMDRYVRVANELPCSRTIKEAERMPPDQRMILIATNRVYRESYQRPLSRAEYLHCLGETIEWCQQLDALAVIKPHPRALKDCDSWGVPQWIASFPNARYRPDIPLVKAVKACDAVLIFNSTVALEAKLLGKPVGMLAADRYSHGVDYLEHGICRKVNCLEDLKALLTSCPNDDSDDSLNVYLALRGTSARTIVHDVLTRLDHGIREPGPSSVKQTIRTP